MKRLLGAGLVAVLVLPLAATQDRSQKAYELIYQDVQLLKQQVQRLEKKLEGTSGEIRALLDLARDLGVQLRALVGEQAKTRDSLQAVPGQFHSVIEKLGQFEAQLSRIASDLQSVKTRVEAAPEEPAAKPGAKAPPKKGPEPVKKTEPPPDKAAAPPLPPSNLSPQEFYNAALADYQKGNYDLAIDGFTQYRQLFPAEGNPLFDNALYMIGECQFSLKKYPQAIEAFDDLIINLSESDAVPRAYYKKGLALAELKKRDEAIAVLKLLISKFPLEEEAKSAAQKIKEWQEGK